MAKYEVTELCIGGEHHYFSIERDNGYLSVTHFRVKDYGLDEARRRAEAEAKWLNERAEKWVVEEGGDGCDSEHSFFVRHKVKSVFTDGLGGEFFVNVLGLDLARAEAERLCQMLNERDASK
jgi:hypothetical protein